MKNKTFLLTVKPELWADFKAKATKDTTINDRIVSLIEGYVAK